MKPTFLLEDRLDQSDYFLAAGVFAAGAAASGVAVAGAGIFPGLMSNTSTSNTNGAYGGILPEGRSP